MTQRKEYYQEEKIAKRKAKSPRGSLYTKKKVKIGPMLSFVVLACMIVTIFLSYVAIHAGMAKTACEISLMKKQLNNLQNDNEQLQLQIMNLTSLDRIERVARTRLGMARPEEVQFVSVPSHKPAVQTATADNQKDIDNKNVLNIVDNLYKKLAKNVGETVKAEAGTF